MTTVDPGRGAARARVVDVAATMLGDRGPAAVTTRAVAEAAGLQAPAIYRLFGDKDGLLEAVAEKVMADFVATKAAVVEAAAAGDVNPVEDLRAGWRTQIEFGLANPAVFRLLSDPDRVQLSAAARAGRELLRTRVRRVAAAGRLRTSEEHTADLLHAAGIGTVQTLLATPTDERDPALAEAMLDAVLARVLVATADGADATGDPALAAAVAFRAVAPELEELSPAERHLVVEWLDRTIAAHG